MKKSLKIIVSLILTIAFLLLCFGLFIVFSFSAWLHTYKAFTTKKLVAVVEVGPEQKDAQGYEYTEIKFKQVEQKSALTSIFSSRKDKDNQFTAESSYKVYGDQVDVGGQFVKFRDFWNLLSIKKVYKITRISGEYSDSNKEKNAPNDKRTVIDVNGGTDSYWKTFQANQKQYSFLVDTVYGSSASKFAQRETRTFGVYATEDGFLIDEI